MIDFGDSSSIIGRIGRVTARITNTHMGEVRVGIRGGSEDYCAIVANAEDVFEVNSPAIVVDILLPRTLIVSKMN